jgi:hypothetical protein
MSQKEKLAAARDAFAKALAEKRRKATEEAREAPMLPPPRYDEVFFEGLKWLDGLAESPATSEGQFMITNDCKGALDFMDAHNIARICHEANRAYCLSLRDTSQPPWDEAPEWQRESAIKGVAALLEGMEAGPVASHARWYELKKSEGWTYSPVKDVEKKTHPCMLPYEELPIEQQKKDLLFTAIVLALKA